ncbi:hypothetical protein G7081_05880 [Vagococcus coleopterorum]|uniref:Uncharacterized protein n=1 Tax=Vagococcus coleopterorum TaxID=2714946 RepID=A0A6G8ANQ9_9ENTE|nr:hypothetical protein [Vagococcus coleopterorum]QIL46636.1 hypothetical protein G7081_05880 [Vagococcus coleopterorum]
MSENHHDNHAHIAYKLICLTVIPILVMIGMSYLTYQPSEETVVIPVESPVEDAK